MTVRDALNSALDEEMSADPKVFIMGEEVFEKLDEKYFTIEADMLLMQAICKVDQLYYLYAGW